MHKLILLVFSIFVSTCQAFGQDSQDIIMKSFSPKSNVYNIYYPENFLISEDENGIVSIYNDQKGIYINISSYSVGDSISSTEIKGKFVNYFKDYFKIELPDSSWREYISTFDNLMECGFKSGENNWMWWIVNKDGILVAISLNESKEISSDDIKLLRYMVKSILLYP